MASDSIQSIIDQHRVLVVLGAGGVGKTSTSIALALRGAAEGKKVALLSIDPAKRLAAAMGLQLSGSLGRVSVDPKHGFRGTLEATMLDQKEVFDAMVRKHAPSKAISEKILVHPVYVAASTNLSGPLEYMALAKLQEIVEDERYDLIVLDTPPDTHALDFLARPNVLAGFMEHKVMSWLIKPFQIAGKLGIGKLLSAGERLMGGVAKVTGVASLHSFTDFLVLMQEVIEGFHRSGERVVSTLRDPRTGFLMVSSPLSNACRSAEFIAEQLEFLGYGCSGIIFNRCLAQDVVLSAKDEADDPAARFVVERAQSQRGTTEELIRLLRQRFPKLFVLKVEESSQDLGNVDGMIAFSKQF